MRGQTPCKGDPINSTVDRATEAKASFLKSSPLFSMLPESELKDLASAFRQQYYKKNVSIFHREEPGNAMFILKQGRVKVILEDSTGREMIVRMFYPTDCFGEMVLLDGQLRSATVTAQVASEVLMLYREDFLTLIKITPTILLNVMQVLSQRLRAADELIRSLVFFDVYGKVARLLLTLASEKGRATAQGTLIDLRLTQQELAELSGMTRETMSRTLRAFHQAGALCIEGNVITILSMEMLERESQ